MIYYLQDICNIVGGAMKDSTETRRVPEAQAAELALKLNVGVAAVLQQQVFEALDHVIGHRFAELCASGGRRAGCVSMQEAGAVGLASMRNRRARQRNERKTDGRDEQ